MDDNNTDGNVYQLRQPEGLLATYRRLGTGYEHLSDEEFLVAAFGQEALESLTKEKTTLEVLDPTRRDNVEREFERRGRRIGW